MSFFQYLDVHAKYFKNHGQKITYPKDSFLVSIHDQSPWVFFLDSGTVQIIFGISSGTDRLIGYFIPGMTFAQSGSFYGNSSEALEYKAITPVTVYRILRQDFFQRLTNNSQFYMEYQDAILRNQIYLIDRIVYQGEQSIEKKFIRWIFFMIKYYSSESSNQYKIFVPLTQDDIANFLHVTRASINKLITHHKKAGLLSVKKKIITIDKQQLNTLTNTP